MNYEFIFVLVLVCIFAILAIFEDIKKRKVSNYISFSFLFISFFYFLYKIYFLDILDLVLIFSGFLISYFAYIYDLFGAGDGKLLIGIFMVLIPFGGANLLLNYMINLALIYSVVMIVLSQLKTSIIDKNLTIRNIRYDELFFILVFSFLIISIIYSQIQIENLKSNLMYFLFGVFFIMYILSHFAKKYYLKISKDQKLILNIFLFLLLFLFNNFSLKYYFFIILLIRILIEYISELSSKIRIVKNNKKIKYHSPFTIYLFLVAIFSILLQSNIIIVFTKFFF